MKALYYNIKNIEGKIVFKPFMEMLDREEVYRLAVKDVMKIWERYLLESDCEIERPVIEFKEIK